MDAETPYRMSPESREHMMRHFSKKNLAGSKFNEAIFPDPESILEFIQENTPFEIIKQEDNIEVMMFKLENGKIAGTCGVAKRSEIAPEKIKRDSRDGFSMDIAHLNASPTTSEFCVVVKTMEKLKSVITAFPGIYAPPFPNNSQTQEKKMESRIFWDSHILVSLLP